MSVPGLEKIHPTLFIGLGGAGGHVLGRLNKLFSDHYRERFATGSKESPLQFLLLDSDDFEKLDPAVKEGLADPEKSFVSLSHFNPRRYAESHLGTKDSDLHRWFDRDALRYLEDVVIHDGASRLRMLGRLCLHHHYHKVEHAIRNKLDAALDADIHTRATRVNRDPRPVRVFLIASSLGGTGSGILLDVAAMTSRIIRQRGGAADMQAFIYLPFPFIEANAQIDPALEGFYQDNAWAFFEELNYFLEHPERLPEFVLDPGRRYGEPPPPADEFGMDLFRTIYLIGDHASTFGKLELGTQLHSYVAHGIFHTFLTPEEGVVQSHYSNIKSKLRDRARKDGSVKRFATFGYAEYRRQDRWHQDRLVQSAVARDWQALLGGSPEQREVAREAEAILTDLLAVIDAARREAREWAPGLPATAGIVREGSSPDKTRMLLASLTRIADDECDEQLKARGDALASEVRKALDDKLDERISDPAHGVLREIAVLAELEALVRSKADELAATVVRGPVQADEEFREQVNELLRTIPEPRQRFGFFGPQRADPRAMSSFTRNVNDLLSRLTAAAQERLDGSLQARAGNALLRLQSAIHDRANRLRVAADLLSESAPPEPSALGDESESPTIQYVPPVHHVHQGRNGDEFYAKHDAATQRLRRDAWAELRPELELRRAEAATRLRARLETIWRERTHAEHADLGIEQWIDRWAEDEAKRAKNGKGDVAKIRHELLARLVPLSTPTCPIDRALVDKADTIPEILAVVGPFRNEGEAQTKLSVPGACALIEIETNDRIAVLQTWYAFSSRAVDGMEALRRSYLNRDRANSLPHLHRDWNRNGLRERLDPASRFSPEEYRHLARALALSRFFGRSGANGAAAPGLHLLGHSPAEMLRYTNGDGRWHLEARCWEPVEGYVDTWTVGAETVQFGHPGLNGGGHDLYRDFTSYLGSEMRQQHAAVLEALDAHERSTAKEQYRAAYLEYIAHLDERIEEERRIRRVLYIPLLEQLAGALRDHVAQLDETTEPPVAW